MIAVDGASLCWLTSTPGVVTSAAAVARSDDDNDDDDDDDATAGKVALRVDAALAAASATTTAADFFADAVTVELVALVNAGVAAVAFAAALLVTSKCAGTLLGTNVPRRNVSGGGSASSTLGAIQAAALFSSGTLDIGGPDMPKPTIVKQIYLKYNNKTHFFGATRKDIVRLVVACARVLTHTRHHK